MPVFCRLPGNQHSYFEAVSAVELMLSLLFMWILCDDVVRRGFPWLIVIKRIQDSFPLIFGLWSILINYFYEGHQCLFSLGDACSQDPRDS